MFSQTAKKKMLARFNDHSMKVGSEYVRNNPGKYTGYTVTDCITFVLRVLEEAFKEYGQPGVSKQLLPDAREKRGKDKTPKFYGDLLARNLVTKQHWKGIYITPDRFHPDDGNQEHTYATHKVRTTCEYTGVPVSYVVMDYRPTLKTDPNYKALFPGKGARKLNAIGLAELKKIKFGYGFSRRGDHTWLYSEGYVYEVHWNAIGKDLFEKTRIENFVWNSSLIVVPPDSVALLAMKNMQECVTP